MYNLNVDLAASAANAMNTLLVENSGGNTPRTPEILNSLIAMTNPLDGYSFGGEETVKTKKTNNNHNNNNNNNSKSNVNLNNSSDSNSSSSSQLESPTSYPPSVQHTCSQLIKAGLKLTLEQKRKHNNSNQSDDGGEDNFLDLDTVKRARRSECSESEEDKIKQELGQLTPEDEERRRRRRERNKIAATKCRLKKRERTANLIQESETLESQNVDLKGQLQDLQEQQRTLTEALALHRPRCRHKIGPATREHLYRSFVPRLPPVSSVMETTHNNNNNFPDPDPVTRSDAGDFLHQLQIPDQQQQQQQTTNNSHCFKQPPPEIVVEEIGGNGSTVVTSACFDELGQFEFNTYEDPMNCHGYAGSYAELGNGCMA